MSYESTLARVRALSEHRFKKVPRNVIAVKKAVTLEPEFIRSLQIAEPVAPVAVKHRSNFEDWMWATS